MIGEETKKRCIQCEKEIVANWRTTRKLDVLDKGLAHEIDKLEAGWEKSLKEIADKGRGAICRECYINTLGHLIFGSETH